LIVFGSHVRVSESGMGCPDWPLCYGQPGPILEFHALMEQGHRYLAAIVSVLVLLSAAMAFWYRLSRPAALRPALFTVAMLGVQVLLGAVTVFAGNGSPTVALHLIGGLALLAGATVTAICVFLPKAHIVGARLHRVSWAGVAAVAILLTSGSLIVDAAVEGLCPSVPFCPAGSSSTETMLHLGHRTVALVTAVVVWAFAIHAWREWSGVRGARVLAALSAGSIILTAAIGATSALLMAPPEWADLHLAGAAAVLVSIVSLTTVGWLSGADAAGRSGGDPGDQLPLASPEGRRSAIATTRVRDGVMVSVLTVLLLSVGYLVGTQQVAATDADGAGGSADSVATPTGHTTTAEVAIEDMRFVPDLIEVPVGDVLEIRLTNNDDREHDVVVDSGQRTSRLTTGSTETLTVGVVTDSFEGWCSIAGHRWLGMTLKVAVTEGVPSSGATSATDHDSGSHDVPMSMPTAAEDASGDLDLMASPGPEFTVRDATLAPSAQQKVHKLRLPVTQREYEVAPGVRQTRWTFAGSAPGPTLRGKVGDRFEITLINRGDIGHSIDFHAGALAPDRPMRTIEPGQELRYTFTATKSGIWLYHCSTMPMSMHIANGMFGAVVIDPPDLAEVDKEFLLVQSELYLGPQRGAADPADIASEHPDLVVFNGYANQYDHRPLQVRAGERVRIWVLAAGPNRGTAFHIVGGQFDTVYSEGGYLVRPGPGVGGSQVLGLATAQGGFIEATLPEPGRYPFVSHVMADAERGAHGALVVR
jgi:heme A synthase/FtsP/CotA-like multicopper oxidase with cupredoxin domain